MRVAADLSGVFDAELTLLYVEPAARRVVQTLPGDPESELARWKHEAEQLGAPRVVAARTSGEAAVVITELADQRGFDLLVMGTHGRVDREHMLTGSITEAVVRRSHCPVLTVHEEWPGALL
jgi:nucleotide-binding universal stress UspA family protein